MSAPYALLSPMPPQNTEIADYAVGLVGGLREHGVELDVYAPTRFIANNPEYRDKYRPIADFDCTQYSPERTIYQIGNNREFHDEIILRFLRYGGVAHMHDLCLHPIFAYFTYLGEPEIYYALLRKWYGDGTSEWIRGHHAERQSLFWEGEYVRNVPLNEEVLVRSRAVIVHSQFAKSAIAAKFPEKPVYVIPQRYPRAVARKHGKGRQLKICSLEFVAPNNCVDKKIEAVALCRKAGVDVRLDVAGRLHPQCERLPQKCAELGIADLVTFHGALEPEALARLLTDSALAVVLREPTLGETSAVAMRALQVGLPLIVNSVGSYSELPDFVQKIPPGPPAARALADILCELATSPTHYEELSAAAFAYAERDATFDASIRRYISALEDIGSDLHQHD